MGDMDVKGTHNILGVNQVGTVAETGKAGFINTVFGFNSGKNIQNSPFTGEEQFYLGRLAAFQDKVAIED